ncbi:MAG: hypothetical protein U9Q07_00450, partial [Planctomycetota bacterium]|nr:hypothetical protein [Planctomycetota bacterium]
MAHEFLGPRMKAGYKKQTTFGTAESLGANDQICWHGDIVFDDAAELVATCGGKRQSTRTTKRQPTASMKMSPPDFGQFILLLYQLMGARTSDPNGNAIRGDGSVGYSMECTWEDSPAIIGTFLACMDGDSKLVELEGCMIKKLTITINAVTGLQVVVDLIANRGYHSDDSDITNTATEAAALTYRHTIDVDAKVFPPACILDRIWLAPREQSTFTSADKICPNEVVIEIVNPYEDMHFDACSDAHQPMVVEARDWIYTLKFASPNEWTYHTRKKTSAPLKIKVEAQGQHGGIGSSYSDTSPATSINTATDSKMKVE